MLILKTHSKRLQDDLTREIWRHYASSFDNGAFKSWRRFMKNIEIFNGNDLKALCKCFEIDHPKVFENTMQMSLNCLISNRNEDPLETMYGLMLKSLPLTSTYINM